WRTSPNTPSRTARRSCSSASTAAYCAGATSDGRRGGRARCRRSGCPRTSTSTTCATRATSSLRRPARRPRNSCAGWDTAPCARGDALPALHRPPGPGDRSGD
ncbi:MAG: hypothetical protein AVDCRST_MAG66-1093, partial [uncultured Pseudonocardia sp.]